jgi:hypothetical protein
MTILRARRPAAALLIAALACGVLQRAPARAGADAFVRARGAQLTVGGKPWRAIGVNLWDLDPGRAMRNDLTGCFYQRANIDSYLDRSFSRISHAMHATAVRTFGFQMPFTAGGLDWSATDKLVYYARKYDVRLVAVIGSQYAQCGSPAKPAAWYRSGYKRAESPWGISYRAYAVALAHRYRNEPAIAFWQLMNEADPSRAERAPDQSALGTFARDVSRAMRAADPNHLVNVGTAAGGAPGNAMPAWGRLLDCGGARGNGCTDLAEAHTYNFNDPLPGLPMPSSIAAVVRVWNAGGDRYELPLASPPIGTWTRPSVGFGNGRSGEPYTRWAIVLAEPRARAHHVYVDDVAMKDTSGATHTYSFERGTDGFRSTGAKLASSRAFSTSGARALVANVGGSSRPRAIRIDAAGADPIMTIAVSLRTDFLAPARDTASTLASNMHAATVTRAKPFVIGEAGIQANVAAAGHCSNYGDTAARAASLDKLFASNLSSEHLGAGVLLWDWKDPAAKITRADGAAATDPAIDCWSVTPGDPAEAVVRRWADRVAPQARALPAPRALPKFGASIALLQPPPAVAGAGATVALVARATRGGNALGGARVTARGGCAGSGLADALGIARFSCAVQRARGERTISFALDKCSCSAVRRVAVSIRSRVLAVAKAGVVRHGTSMPLRLELSEPAGNPLGGARWSVEGCGASGTVRAKASRAVVTATCPTRAWRGARFFTVRIGSSPMFLPTVTSVRALNFDKLYVDAASGDCVGIDAAGGWGGATDASGACGKSGFRDADAWFACEVPDAQRAASFETHGDQVVASIDCDAVRRVRGTFSNTSGDFTAVLTRSDGAHALRS